MNSSKSSAKHAAKSSFKSVTPFALFYQVTYLSAMASADISRGKLFEMAARSRSGAAEYFVAVNTLVAEMRLDYPEACRRVGLQAKSENMRSFLLRMSDALRSGEPMADFLSREAEVQHEDYESRYERDLEALKQWSNAFSSIVISVALIVIIQVISSMIYTINPMVLTGLVFTGVTMAGFGAWIIWRSAPKEIMIVSPARGSVQQQRSLRMFRLMLPLTVALTLVLALVGVSTGLVMIISAAMILPIGVISFMSDSKVVKKDREFSTFLRSTGGMATATGTTLKQALTRIDLSPFPHLAEDIKRLSTRLEALVEPVVCWHKFGIESGSRLISEVSDIFYGAVKIGGDPERVGYLCSLFVAKTTQLRAKRRLTAGTFSGLTTVMQGVVSGLMVFVLSIVNSFAVMIAQLTVTTTESMSDVPGAPPMSLGLAQFSPEDLQFLGFITLIMVLLLALVSAAAIILSDGGYKLKVLLYLSLTIFISGVAFLVIPGMVSGMLTL